MKSEYSLQGPPFTVKNIMTVNASRPVGYKHTYRCRPHHAFVYTVSGKMWNSIEGRALEAEAGELVFYPAGTHYTSIYSGENTEIKIVQFDLASGSLPDYLSAPCKIILPDAGERMEPFFLPEQGHPFYYLSCLYAFLQQVDENYSRLPAKYRRLQPALAELGARPARNEKVAYYAALCGMSEAGFRRLFREFTGRAPVDYRNELRLERARSLLRSGEYNVSEAAEKAGFSNLSFFIRLYKMKYGHTPKKE
ncbi:MAG: helix-turn-helix transcriptional regulator [Clostridia bacterium]|nr:helix-turn-helix transcriptional regulator [Clostridia bacterium]